MAKIPGSSAHPIIPNVRTLQLGIDNNRLTALVAALLAKAGGSVTLTKEESEKIWENPKIKYTRTPTDGISLALEGFTPEEPKA